VRVCVQCWSLNGISWEPRAGLLSKSCSVSVCLVFMSRGKSYLHILLLHSKLYLEVTERLVSRVDVNVLESLQHFRDASIVSKAWSSNTLCPRYHFGKIEPRVITCDSHHWYLVLLWSSPRTELHLPTLAGTTHFLEWGDSFYCFIPGLDSGMCKGPMVQLLHYSLCPVHTIVFICGCSFYLCICLYLQ
jgi:hypothetical protein